MIFFLLMNFEKNEFLYKYNLYKLGLDKEFILFMLQLFTSDIYIFCSKRLVLFQNQIDRYYNFF